MEKRIPVHSRNQEQEVKMRDSSNWTRETERGVGDRRGVKRTGKSTGRKEKPRNCDQSQVRDGEGGNRGKQERNNERKFRNKLNGSALNTAVITNWETERDCAETLVPKLMAWSTSH